MARKVLESVPTQEQHARTEAFAEVAAVRLEMDGNMLVGVGIAAAAVSAAVLRSPGPEKAVEGWSCLAVAIPELRSELEDIVLVGAGMPVAVAVLAAAVLRLCDLGEAAGR